jgi:hypothetical protein
MEEWRTEAKTDRLWTTRVESRLGLLPPTVLYCTYGFYCSTNANTGTLPIVVINWYDTNKIRATPGKRL